MYVDAHGKGFESIQGRRATVIEDSIVFLANEDRVVILENDTVAFCISTKNYKEGSNSIDDYGTDLFSALVVDEELIIEGDEE